MNEAQATAISQNLVELTQEQQRDLVQGLKNVPISKMVQQIQYLQQQMLPQAEKKYGRDNENYKFYQGIVDTLIWSTFILDRYQTLETKYHNQNMMLKFYQQQCTFQEKELLKYTTIEDLILSDSLNDYSTAIGKRLQDLINVKNVKG
jgi:hypothetical protein